MSVKVKSVDVAAKKFAQRGAAAAGDYSSGVNGTTDQAERAIAAKDAFVAGMNDAIARGAREAGLTKAGTSKWKSKALSLGVQRFGPGITAAQGDYSTGVKPYLDTIAGLDLPVRGPKGSPENLERVRVVNEALRNKKIAG